MNPDHEAAYNHRGCILSQLGCHEEAVLDLSRVIRLTPNIAAIFSIVELLVLGLMTMKEQ